MGKIEDLLADALERVKAAQEKAESDIRTALLAEFPEATDQDIRVVQELCIGRANYVLNEDGSAFVITEEPDFPRRYHPGGF
jgi:hypothetical protein